MVTDVNLDKDIRLLAAFGRILVIGTTAWNMTSILPRYIYMGEIDIRGVALGIDHDFWASIFQCAISSF